MVKQNAYTYTINTKIPLHGSKKKVDVNGMTVGYENGMGEIPHFLVNVCLCLFFF